MKTEEDEAFDELARKQGSWGGGFQAKRQMAADKLHWSDCAVHNAPAYPAGECDCGAMNEMTKDEALKIAREVLENLPGFCADMEKALDAIKEALAQPAQEPVACERCKQLEEQAYDLLGQLKAANLKWSVAHPWVGLTDQESMDIIKQNNNYLYPIKLLQAVMDALKEKNT
jgi:hypothetical protein